MISELQRRSALWMSAGGMLGAVACGGTFSHDCTDTRSCAVPSSGTGGAGDDGDRAAGGAPEPPVAGAGAGADAGAGGEEPGDGCKTSAECGNADPADGEENCVAGACVAGNVPPRVLSITPNDGADDAETSTTITVVFSEALDPDTVTPAKVRLLDGDSEVAGDLELNEGRDRLTLKPTEPLQLWTAYSVEVSPEIADVDGASLVEDASSSFQVRDGAWSLTTLAQGGAFQLPFSLPVASSGATLPAWLDQRGAQCSAHAAWVLRGQTKPSELLQSTPLEGNCNVVSASVAPDGGAAAAWVIGKTEWSQSFADGSWAPQERKTNEVNDAVINDVQVLAHDAAHITLVSYLNGRSGYLPFIERGTARDAWAPEGRLIGGGSRVQFAVGADRSAFAASTRDVSVEVIAYDAAAGVWADETTALPGISADAAERSVPGIAVAAQGDVQVVWVEGAGDKQALKSSHFTPGQGWDDAPATVSASVTGNPLFDAPALLFDGSTFVSAWTGKSGGKLATYTARYDLHSGQWHTDDPHITDRGASAAFSPRLGVDSHRNLMLLWAIAGEPITLAYQRYRAETDTWGAVEAVNGVSFTDATFATEGKLPFGFAPNGLGAVLFRSGTAGSQTLKLAQFF